MSDDRSTDRFSALSDVELRDAWQHEANDFTPWLGANLGRIADIIGVRLDLEGTEVEVGNYSADILAVDPDGNRVLIENQLEWSDHRHLGQILTYLAGLDARTVIWVARDFNESHLSAVHWLNQATNDDFAFFAVRVRVVKIDDSPLAPIFEVLERPSGWERQIRATVRENSSPISRFRREFWSHYSKRHPDDEIPDNYATSSVWHKAQNANLMISTALGQNSVGIWYRGTWGESSEQYTATVKRYETQIRDKLGIDIGDDPVYPCYQEKAFDAQNRANWDDMADWLHQKLREYRRAIESGTLD